MSEKSLFTADAVEALTKLAHIQDVEFMALPETALPPGMLVDEPHVMVIRSGDGRVNVESLTPHIEKARGKPSQRKGTATALTLRSFIDLVNRHAKDESAVFVDPQWRQPHLTAVIDYHAATPSIAPAKDGKIDEEALAAYTEQFTGFDDPGARFLQHRINYDFPLSESWKTWLENNGTLMDQDDFARFIEEHINETASPENLEIADFQQKYKMRCGSPIELVELARGLEVNVEQRVKSKSVLASGERQIVFETEHRDAQNNAIDVPGLFLLNVPIFYGGEEQRIPCRLRYRVNSGVLKWGYEILRPDIYIDERVQEDVAAVERETGLPVYAGAPEV